MLVPVQLRPPVPYLHLLPIVDVLKAPNHGAFFCLGVYFLSIVECCLGFSCIEGIDWDMLPKSCTPLGKVSALSA